MPLLQLEDYQLSYAQRHHIPAHWILKEERLELAAFLEHMIYTHTLTVRDARRRFVEQYPDSNRLAVGKTIYEWINGVYTYHNDDKYAVGSVLNLIQPFDDSIYGEISL